MTKREPNAYEIGAMYLYGEDYARTGMSAVDYFRRKLSSQDQMRVMEMVDRIRAAPEPRELALRSLREVAPPRRQR